jgi:hypothetical protein
VFLLHHIAYATNVQPDRKEEAHFQQCGWSGAGLAWVALPAAGARGVREAPDNTHPDRLLSRKPAAPAAMPAIAGLCRHDACARNLAVWCITQRQAQVKKIHNTKQAEQKR